jgi:DNA-binding response OmpR family regulator
MTETAASPTPLRGVHVAVVSGDRGVLESLTHVLRYCGALVTAHDTARSVLRLMEIVWVNALVVDLGDGDLGVTLIRSVRALKAEDGGEIPVIALVPARVDPQAHLFDEGVDSIIRKPVQAAELGRVIADVLGSSTRGDR